MDDLRALAAAARFQPRPGADAAALAQVEAAFGVALPDDFRALWASSDGMDSARPALPPGAGRRARREAQAPGIRLLPLAEMAEYAAAFAGGAGYVPFTDCNDSNPYAVGCRGPLRGAVVHLMHDDESRLVCRGLGRFLELVAAARDGGEVDRLPGDFADDHPDRTAEDAATARELVRLAEGLEREDDYRAEALRFAAQLFGPGREAELAGVLAAGDEYVREAVRARWESLDTPAARQFLADDDAAYTRFLAELRAAFEAAGVQVVEHPADGDGTFRLAPGNTGLNFAMLFADCRRPGALAEWVLRFQGRLGTAGP